MKRTKQFSGIILASAMTLVLSACTLFLGEESGAGNVAITIGGNGSRTAAPAWLGSLELEDLVHTIQVFDASGAEKHRVDNLRYGQTSSFSVTPGLYTFKVEAHKDGELKAEGSMVMNIKPGPNDAVIITMTPPGGENGTEQYPFKVFSVATLEKVGSGIDGWDMDKHYKLMADITLPAVSRNESNWTPIGDYANQFIGTFDGNGKKITGLNFYSNNSDLFGLFGAVGTNGTVKNLGVEMVYVYSAFTGGVVGNNYGTVSNCYSTSVELRSWNSTAGGVVGQNYGIVSNCYFTGSISSSSYIGGVVGPNYGTVSNCYSIGSVRGNSDEVGGVVGNNNSSGTVSNCVALNPSVRGASRVGRVVGISSGTLANNYANSDMSYGDGTPFTLDPTTTQKLDGIDGADVTIAETEDQNWWITTAGWNSVWGTNEDAPWQWDSVNNRPKLWFE